MTRRIGAMTSTGNRGPGERLVAAGGVVVQIVDDRLEVALCGHREPPQWRLPKGTPDAGETLEQTALREVREETGLEVRILAPVGRISYTFTRPEDAVQCHKTVHFYLMAPTGGSPDLHDAEFDEVCWFPWEEAVERLAFSTEARMVRKAARAAAQRHHEQQ